MTTPAHSAPWWQADEGEAHERVFIYVSTVDQAQASIFDRFVKLAWLYDPLDMMGMRTILPTPADEAQVSENAIQSAIDTATSIIAKNRPRVTFQTDGADWSTQRRAKLLERYVEGLFKQTKIYSEGVKVFRDAAVFGTGILKIYPLEEDGKIVAERVIPDEILVDEAACRTAPPREMHQRRLVDRHVLAAEFPDNETEIAAAHQSDSFGGRLWAEYRPREDDQVVVVESWRLPVGDKPGRHTICVHNATLLDEDWDRDWFPFVVYRLTDRLTGWYGRGMAEVLAGRQRRINKYNRAADAQIDQGAFLRMFVHVADAQMVLQQQNRAGLFYTYKNKPPEYKMPPAVSPDLLQRIRDLYAGAFEEVGISRLTAQAKKPAGIESAVALRELTDTETERFAIQAIAFEQMYVEAATMMIRWAKEMNTGAPKVDWRRKKLSKVIKWKDVDLGELPFSMSIDAAGALSRTPAGRMQAVIEWAQAGIVSQDEARRLLDHPDLERAMSLYNAALESLEMSIELIEDGERVVPEPYDNLQMGIWRFNMAYHLDRQKDAPEEVLEALRNWILQAQHILKPPAAAAGEAMPMPAPVGMGGLPPAPPQLPPQAALAAPAMAIQAA